MEVRHWWWRSDISLIVTEGPCGIKTYLKRSGKSQPAASQNLAFGESSPGRPLKRTSCSCSSLSNPRRVKNIHPSIQLSKKNALVNLSLPLLNFFPSLLIQEVVDLHHSLNLVFRSFPSLPDQRVVELLRRGILPVPRGIAGYGRRGAFSGKILGL